MTDDHTFYLQTHWDQCDIPLNLRDPNYLCTYPHRSLWFCSKNKKSLSSTNTASCVLDSSLFQYLSVSLFRLLPIYRDTQVSQWTRIRDGEIACLFPIPSPAPLQCQACQEWSSLPCHPSSHYEMAFMTATLVSTGSHLIAFPVSPSPIDLNHGSSCPATLYPLDVPAMMPMVTN